MARSPVDPADRERHLDEVLAAYLEAVTAGQNPDRQDLIDRHPELAEELRGFFADYDRLQCLADPLRPVAQAARAGDPGTEPAPPPTDAEAPRQAPGCAGLTATRAPGQSAGDLTTGSGDGAVPADGDKAELPRGTTVRYFGDYELKRVLGQGGMGVVYRAKQLSLNRPVALKMIRAGLWAGEDEVRRFKNEAEAVANLDHPRIVTIHEVGEHSGRHYFSMKLVEGPSLAERLDVYAARPRDAATLVAEVARAVHHAHQRGILHRDLKPSNILLDAEGHPHVTDFGLARRIEGDGSLSASGSIVGTPQYMSPEQASGSRRGITTATDVYGLGALLYAALTARPPFQADSVVETLSLVQEQPAQAPSRVNRKVDRDLETICLKCLEKDPRRRYASAAAVAEDLERYLRGEPILARRTSVPERVMKWARRRPAIASLVALLHLVAGLGLAGILWQWQKAEEQRDFAIEARNEAVKAQQAEARANATLRWNSYFERIALARSELLSRNVGRAEDLLENCPQNLRGWEWHCLKRLRHQEPLILRGHTATIFDLVFSPDGRRLASAQWQDGTVILWDPLTAHDVLRIRTHASLPTNPSRPAFDAVSFSPDGRRLATASNDLTVRIWDAGTGRQLRVLHGHTEPVRGVAFSPDGRSIVSAGGDETIRIWDAATGQTTRVIPTHRGIILWMSLSPDGHRLATQHMGSDTMSLWELETGRELLERVGPVSWLGQDSFSPNGRWLVTPLGDGVSAIRDAATGWAASEQIHGGMPRFSRDGRRLASIAGDTIKLWDAATAQEVLTLSDHLGLKSRLAFSPDGRFLAVGAWDGSIELWDGSPLEENHRSDQWTMLSQDQPIGDLVFSPDGRFLAAAGGEDRTVRVWDLASGREVKTIRGPEGRVWSVAYNRDGSQLAATGADRTVRLWDAATGQALRTLEGLEGRGNELTFSPDGRFLAVREDFRIRIWDLASGRLAGFDWAAGDLYDMAYSPDGRFLATAEESALQIREGRSGQRLHVLGHIKGVLSVAFSPDGRFLATARDRNIQILDTTRWAEVRTLRGSDSPFTTVVYSPAGRFLASSARNGTVVLWDVASGRILRILKGPLGWAFLAFSPDGLRLAAASSGPRSGHIQVWELSRLDLTVDLREEAARMFALGRQQRQAGEWAVAVRSFQQAMDILDPLVNAYTGDLRARRDLAATTAALAEAYAAEGRVHAAEEMYRQAVVVRERLMDDHPGDDRLPTELAEGYEALGDFAQWKAGKAAEAVQALERARAIYAARVREVPDDSQRRYQLAAASFRMIWPCYDSGRLDRAMQAVQEAMDLWDQVDRKVGLDLDTLYLEIADDCVHQGQFLAALGRNAEALRVLEEHRRRLERLLADERFQRDGLHPHREGCKYWIAFCIATRGRVQQALRRFEEADHSRDEARAIIAGFPPADSIEITVALANTLPQIAALIGQDKTKLTAADQAERQALADRAMVYLRRALGDSHFIMSRHYVATSPNFEVLRPRADFQLLLQDLSFPSWPFEGDPPVSAP